MKQPSLYLLLNNQTAGPYAAPSVKSMWDAGAVNGLTLCCLEGMADWVPLRTYAEDLGVAMVRPFAAPDYSHSPYSAPLREPVIQVAKRGNGCLFAIGLMLTVFGALACLTFIGSILGVPMIIFGLLMVAFFH
jgi:hypothetical protein